MVTAAVRACETTVITANTAPITMSGIFSRTARRPRRRRGQMSINNIAAGSGVLVGLERSANTYAIATAANQLHRGVLTYFKYRTRLHKPKKAARSVFRSPVHGIGSTVSG